MRNIFALLIAFTLGTTGSLAQTVISNYKQLQAGSNQRGSCILSAQNSYPHHSSS